ncbi:hypothetical protein [Enemella evansiae]|uniref:hypothetical protein n=1 Tax=Enemella evansiae TaxID=2016499 RepID=UPI00117F536B|nr:hypothetical protein [Enemella evansiae]
MISDRVDESLSDVPASSARARARSTIKFPYTDIKDAQQVAKTVKGRFGSSCSVDQLAAALQQKSTSGAFRVKLATAATFGVITHNRGDVALTPLGQDVADDREGALVAAFMNVPLYAAIYERYQGTSLPSDAGLESEMLSLGVAAKQTDKARQAFTRSAEKANLFWSGRERLVMPPSSGAAGGASGAAVAGSATGSSPDSTASLADDPILQGLWRKLPAEGSFPKEDRERWFAALRVNLELVYGPVDQHAANPSEE